MQRQLMLRAMIATVMAATSLVASLAIGFLLQSTAAAPDAGEAAPGALLGAAVYAPFALVAVVLPALAVPMARVILAAGFGAGKATSTVVFEDWIEPIANRARLRVINASPDTPILELALPGGLHILPQVIFKTASKYYTLPANTYDLAVRVTSRNELILRDVKLEKGKVYTAFIVGRRADGTLNYLLTEDRTP